MKFTIVFTTLLCISTSLAIKVQKIKELKGKREAPVSYPGFGSHYQASASLGDPGAISVGAGYSIGGSKPSYSFAGPHQSSGGSLHIPSEALSPNGHATIQLAPITLQSGGHGPFAAADLTQIMNHISQGLNSGDISLQHSTPVAEFHQGSDGAGQGHELSLSQYGQGVPKFDLSQQLSNSAYGPGGSGLSSYTSTGPVLFTPSDSQQPVAAGPPHGAANSGHSLGEGSLSLGGSDHSFGSPSHSFGGSSAALSNSGHSFGGSSHSLGGPSYSLGNSGHSLGDSSHSFAGASHSLGNSGHSFGGPGFSLGGNSLTGSLHGGPSISLGGKQFSSGYTGSGKNSFKPSGFLGASITSDNSHGISSFSASHGAPSFGSFRGGSHGGLSFGSPTYGLGHSGASKYIGRGYQSGKTDSLGLSGAQFASPPGTTYGTPGSAYSANNAHAASAVRPYYINSKHYRAPSHFSHSSSGYRGAPASFSSNSGPKYSFSGANVPFESADAHGAASESSYNTIKYSEDMKPHVN